RHRTRRARRTDLLRLRDLRLDLFSQSGRRGVSGGLDEDLAQRRARARQRRAPGAFLEMTLQSGTAGRVEFAVIPRIEEVSDFVAGHAACPIRRLMARV